MLRKGNDTEISDREQIIGAKSARKRNQSDEERLQIARENVPNARYNRILQKKRSSALLRGGLIFSICRLPVPASEKSMALILFLSCRQFYGRARHVCRLPVPASERSARQENAAAGKTFTARRTSLLYACLSFSAFSLGRDERFFSRLSFPDRRANCFPRGIAPATTKPFLRLPQRLAFFRYDPNGAESAFAPAVLQRARN